MQMEPIKDAEVWDLSRRLKIDQGAIHTVVSHMISLQKITGEGPYHTAKNLETFFVRCREKGYPPVAVMRAFISRATELKQFYAFEEARANWAKNIYGNGKGHSL